MIMIMNSLIKRYTVEPPCATTSRKQPPPISDRQSKRQYFPRESPTAYSWNL